MPTRRDTPILLGGAACRTLPVIAANTLLFAAVAWTLARNHAVPRLNPAASLPAVSND